MEKKNRENTQSESSAFARSSSGVFSMQNSFFPTEKPSKFKPFQKTTSPNQNRYNVIIIKI